MKKYATILSIAWQRAFEYRGASFVFNTLFLINAFLNIAIWTVVLKSPSYRSEESFATFITYYVILILIHQLLQSYTGTMIANDHIKHGELSVYLLKPFPYIRFIFLLELPWRILQFLLSLPVAAVLFYVFQSSVSLSLSNLFLGILTIPVAYILSFLIQVIVALLTFWFEDTYGFFNVVEVLTLLFSGAGVAIFFLPPFLQYISSVLPFQYTIYYPIATIIGRIPLDIFLRNYLILTVWVILLAWVQVVLWKKGLKKFTGEGI